MPAPTRPVWIDSRPLVCDLSLAGVFAVGTALFTALLATGARRLGPVPPGWLRTGILSSVTPAARGGR